MDFIDYYLVLGISRNATEEEIRSAYHKLAKEYHPDTHAQENLSEEEKRKLERKLAHASEAYSVLKNKVTKEDYDFQYDLYYESLRRKREARQNRSGYTDGTFDFIYYGNHRDYEEEQQDDYERYRDTKKYKRRRHKKKNAFSVAAEVVEYIITLNNEIKDEEEETFGQRHNRISRRMNRKYGKNVKTTAQGIVFNFAKGSVHICSETAYQFSKLKTIKEDSVPKYVLRNKATIGTAVLGVILAINIVGANTKKEEVPEVIPITMEETDATQEMSYQENIILDNVYTVKPVDTLSQLAFDSGNTVESLQQINNMSNTNIIIGQELSVPYIIDREDLQYYTQLVDTEGKSIYDLAKEYNTTVNTLYDLNEEKIICTNDTYIIIDTELLVPNFISQKELNTLKNNQDTKTY